MAAWAAGGPVPAGGSALLGLRHPLRAQRGLCERLCAVGAPSHIHAPPGPHPGKFPGQPGLLLPWTLLVFWKTAGVQTPVEPGASAAGAEPGARGRRPWFPAVTGPCVMLVPPMALGPPACCRSGTAGLERWEPPRRIEPLSPTGSPEPAGTGFTTSSPFPDLMPRKRRRARAGEGRRQTDGRGRGPSWEEGSPSGRQRDPPTPPRGPTPAACSNKLETPVT